MVARLPEYIDVDAEEDLAPQTNGWDHSPTHVRARDGLQRTMSGLSEQDSEHDSSGRHGPSAPKRRRMDDDVPQEVLILPTDSKGKGRPGPPLDDVDSVSSMRGRKRGKKRGDESSAFGDESPSRGPSPAPSVASAVYEIGESIPPLKKARKVDDVTMAKRLRNLEDAQRKVWTMIARKDVVKVTNELKP
jgi:hypothetical protein